MATGGGCLWEWWRAPAYLSVSVLLAFIAISTTLSPSPPPSLSHHDPNNTIIALSFNASLALRNSGFNIIASLLHTSPHIFFSSSSSSLTIFALKDSPISNASLPPPLVKHLLRYHTSPFRLSFQDLLNTPPRACFPTLLPLKNISITNVNLSTSSVEINHVLISHPNLFLSALISIHGVLAPFSPIQLGFDFIEAPTCSSSVKNMVDWTHIVSLLSSNGYVSFAVGLHSVLDRIVQDFTDVHSVTLFSPPDLNFVASPSPLLYRIVRYHIVAQRFTYAQLDSLAADTPILPTLLPHSVVQIYKNLTALTINGVGIVEADMLSSNKFVVHGISRAFHMPDLPYTS